MNIAAENSTTVPTVFVIDDDRSVLHSIHETLRVTELKIACFSSAQEFFLALDEPTAGCAVLAGCVITDVKMPQMSGLQLQQELLERGQPIPVIVISGRGDVATVRTAMKQGALDFLEKPYEPDQLRALVLEAIEKDALRRGNQAQEKQVSDLLGQLTAEERQVIEGIAAGKTAKVISQELHLSLRTIQFRRSSAMNKLDATRAELVEIVLRNRGVKL